MWLRHASSRDKLEEGRQKLHDYYGDKEDLTDKQENYVYENLTKLAKEDSLCDLRGTLQELYDSCD